MATSASLSPLMSAIADEVRATQAARRERRRLRLELSRYDSSSERHELEAILHRHSPEDAAEIRSLLHPRSLAG